MIILTQVTERTHGYMKVTLTTGRSVAQGEAKETGKAKEDYVKAAAICELDPEDMRKLGADEGDPVRVSTAYGEVIVKAVKSKQAPHPGVAFVPMGPWASSVVNPDTSSTGMPSMKDVEAEVELAKDARVLGTKELIRERYLKFKQIA